MSTETDSLCVLVADDNRDAADSSELLVRLWGYRAVVVDDGKSALAEARLHRPAAALLDIAMPGLDGCEVARLLRSVPGLEKALLVAVTGYGREADRRRCLEA